MVEIQHTQASFVQLWLRLERTRQLLEAHCRRFCIRNVLRDWLGQEATDDFIWEVCNKAVIDDEPLCGYDLLPLPSLCPRPHRELLRALVAVRLGIGLRKVNLRALDAAYTVAFPASTPINVNKKRENHLITKVLSNH